MKSREWVTRNADGSCPWNSGKEARPFKGIIVSDTDGDGKEPVTLNGTRSRDMDGIVTHYTWYASGVEIAVGPTKFRGCNTRLFVYAFCSRPYSQRFAMTSAARSGVA